jgi:GTP-binding protein Era
MMDIIDEKEYERVFEEEFEKQKFDYDELSKKTLTISLVGTVDSGKSSTINALTGRKLADVKARAGWTKKVTVYIYSNNVFIADTPGLSDINKDVSQRAQDFIEKDTDIIIFFLNAAVGITANEKAAIDAYKAMGKPLIIVLNKIDIWLDSVTGEWEREDMNEVIAQIVEETNINPIPISAKRGINIQGLHSEIVDILEKGGKDLLFLKISKYKEGEVSKWIMGATGGAAAIGALPIPGSDIVTLTGLQVGLAIKIAFIYDCKISKKDAMQLVASTIAGGFGRQAYRVAITAMKGLGWISGGLMEIPVMAVAAGVAASTTYAFGWAANFYYKNNMEVSFGDVSKIFIERLEEYKNKKKAN